MRKVLLVSYFFPPLTGGLEQYLAAFSGLFPADQIIVLTNSHSTADSAAAAFDQAQNYRIIRVDFFDSRYLPGWAGLLGRIKRLIKEEGIELVVFGHYHHLAIIGRLLSVPFMMMLHGTDAKLMLDSPLSRMMFRFTAAAAEKIIFNSNYLRQTVGEELAPPAKSAVIYPPLSAELTSRPAKSAARQALNLPPDNLIILSVSRLVATKNIQGIIRALPQLIARRPDLLYIVVGDGNYRQSLNDLAVKLNVAQNVVFVGEVTDPAAKQNYYAAADIFALIPSQPEGFGLVYAEAQAAGLPVVAGQLGGAAEIVAANESGLLVDPDNAEQIAAAFNRLMDDQSWRESLGATGQNQAAKFSLANFISAWQKIL